MRYIIFFLLLFVSVKAETLHYKVKAPLFGTIGQVNINYRATQSNYMIDASMKTSGFAKTLSGNREEHYQVNGKVSGQNYLAQHFKQKAHFKKSDTILEYSFDYQKKKIRKIKKKWKNSKLINSTDRYLNYFATNDLFSAYHNIVKKLSKRADNTSFIIKAAGLEKFYGKLEVSIPSQQQQKKEARELGVKDVRIFHIITHKKILGSENGEIIFAVGTDGIAKAVRVLHTSYVSHIDAFLLQ